jgi:hypothetical protein
MAPFAGKGHSLKLPGSSLAITLRVSVTLGARHAHVSPVQRKTGLLMAESQFSPRRSRVAGNARRRPTVEPALMRVFVAFGTAGNTIAPENLRDLPLDNVSHVAFDAGNGFVSAIEDHPCRVMHAYGKYCRHKALLDMADSAIAYM